MPVMTMSSQEARRRWWEALDVASSGRADVIIEQDGEPVAVLIAIADYQGISAELERLRAAHRNLAGAAEIGERDLPRIESDYAPAGRAEYTPF